MTLSPKMLFTINSWTELLFLLLLTLGSARDGARIYGPLLYALASAHFEPTSVELHQTGTFWRPLYRLNCSAAAVFLKVDFWKNRFQLFWDFRFSRRIFFYLPPKVSCLMAPLGIQLELFSSEQTFGARSSTYLFSEDIKFDCRVEFDTQAIDLEALECIRKVFSGTSKCRWFFFLVKMDSAERHFQPCRQGFESESQQSKHGSNRLMF